MESMEEEAEDEALKSCTELKYAVFAGSMDEGAARELGELWMGGSQTLFCPKNSPCPRIE